MKSRDLIPAETLNEYMLMHGLDKEAVAEKMHASVRTVYRWVKYGIPVVFWENLTGKKGK
jgi:hypothetical protein